MDELDLETELFGFKVRSVGVAGCGGFVGGACYYTFNQSSKFQTYGYDINPEKTKNTMEETYKADLVFLCVPTPMTEDGKCHLGIVESVLEDIRKLRQDNVVVIKSTVLPKTTERLNEDYGRVMFSPEFLTERRYIQDFIELPYQMLGYPRLFCQKYGSSTIPAIREFFSDLMNEGVLKATEIIEMDSTQAEMVKYFRNCYLATRISFCNEMFDLCEKLGITYEIVSEQAGLDKRIGNHYNKIDRKSRSFGGVCLPKDLNAMISLGKELDTNPVLLQSVWDKNLQVATDRDWERQPGRATIKKEK